MNKFVLGLLVTFGTLTFGSSAMAQYVTPYPASANVAVARPVYTPPVSAYYTPAPVIAYRPASTVYRPAVGYRPPVAAPVGVAATTYGRPVYQFYSPYGGPEVRVPGQPILNAIRAIVP